MITASNAGIAGLSWWHIIRLGLIQTSLGGIVVLTTSTLNRIMVVELAMAATIPGFLVTIHHVVQLARPRIGYGSDVGGRRTPWIIGGMFILGLGGVLAALGTTLIPSQYWLGMSVSALGFFAIGVGTGATGTSPASVARQACGAGAKAGCRGARVVHDDHRLRGHRRCRGALSGSLLPRAPDDSNQHRVDHCDHGDVGRHPRYRASHAT